MSGAPAVGPVIPDDLRCFIIEDDFTRYALEPGYPTSSPRYVQIELTDLCNLACGGCVRAQHQSEGSHFGLRAFGELLDQLPDLEHVSFVGAGEALIVRDFAAYVNLCTTERVFTSCNTNGLLVMRRLSPVIDAGLGLIAISVDGADDEVLGSMRSGLRLSQLTTALQSAVSLTEGARTRVSAAVTLSCRNIERFRDIVAYVAELGVGEISVESLHHWGADKTLNTESLFALHPDTVTENLERGLREALRRGIHLRIFDYSRLSSKGEHLVCPWPWDACYITRHGDVTPCCVNLEAEPHNLLGNVHRTPIAEIWTGRRYEALRRSFLNGDSWTSCQGCVYRKEFGRALR